jgi:hypothetical protein
VPGDVVKRFPHGGDGKDKRQRGEGRDGIDGGDRGPQLSCSTPVQCSIEKEKKKCELDHHQERTPVWRAFIYIQEKKIVRFAAEDTHCFWMANPLCRHTLGVIKKKKKKKKISK